MESCQGEGEHEVLFIRCLFWCEVNSEIENAAAEQRAPEAKEKGEKSPD